MKPILLKGHTRSLTKVKYNSYGDLLFSVSKDNQACLWFSHNGERLGTYKGHNGAIWDLDVSFDSSLLLTGSADNSCILWDVESGKSLFKWETKTAVRVVAFSEGDKLALFVTDATMGQLSKIHIVSIHPESEPQLVIVIKGSKATTAAWGSLNKEIYTGHEDGTISVFDATTGELLRSVKHHSASITDMQFSRDKSHFITSSKDHSAMIYESSSLTVLKKFQTERPVNSATMSPIRPHIILGGGQEAMSVTTTSAKQEKFEARFFHLVFEQEFGRVKGHFGPINTLAFHPDGRSFVSGGEDGYIRIHHFDPDYFKFKYPEEKFE